jgi:hypothetical protein
VFITCWSVEPKGQLLMYRNADPDNAHGYVAIAMAGSSYLGRIAKYTQIRITGLFLSVKFIVNNTRVSFLFDNSWIRCAGTRTVEAMTSSVRFSYRKGVLAESG